MNTRRWRNFMDEGQSERDAITQFRERLRGLDEESVSVHEELRRRDLLALGHRTQELVRVTRTILEGNISILFGNEPAQVAQDLKQHVEFAENHVRLALGQEHDFEVIQQRLYMA